MTAIRCRTCGEEHDLSRIEPSFTRPDAFFAVPPDQRDRRINADSDTCLISSEDGQTLACFIRAVLRVPIQGAGATIGWGLWVEVSDQTYGHVSAVWNEPAQIQEPPFPCTVANEIPNYQSTRGLPGTMRLTGIHTRPALVLAADSQHPFAVEARTGVPLERSLEWRSWAVHRP